MSKLVFRKVKELYIMRRKSFIMQSEDGSYITSKGYLGDNLLQKHLDGQTTVGVFSGQIYTNFICFDFDYNSIQQAEISARQLIQTLKDLYYLGDNNILTTVSGGKGYHVEVFFKNPIFLKDAKNFYLDILHELDKNKRNIEFRPTSTQAVKLPLSFHRKHKKRCHIVSNATFKPVSDVHILEIDCIDELKFLDTLGARVLEENLGGELVNLSKDEVADFEEVVTGLNTNLDIDRVKRCINMLSEFRLLYRGSRHNSTLLLLMYLNEEGYSQEDCISIVQNVIKNTFSEYRDLVDKATTLEYALNEVSRLYKYAVKYNLTDSNQNKDDLYIYEDEILTILNISQLTLKRVLFVLLIHSKKYANKKGVFYMTYKQMGEMGLSKNGYRVMEHIDSLVLLGVVERVETHGKNISYYKEPNHYRILVEVEDYGKKISIKDIELSANNFEEIVSKLLDEEVVKKIVGRYQFNNYFKKHYKQAV